MGILFENLEPWDWQGEHERAKKEKERADQEKERADQEKERADQEKERADQEKERADEAEERADIAEARAEQAAASVNKAVSDSVFKTKRDSAKGLYSAGVSIEQIAAGLSEDTQVIESWVMEEN